MSIPQDNPKTESISQAQDNRSSTRQKNVKYQVSTNRGHAKHKVRYVESGGGEADPNCRLCTPVIKLKD
jgi:hypothetical protein